MSTSLDDRSPSIVYSGGPWFKGGSKFEHDSTTTWTARPNSYATVTFRGTSIGVYGTIPKPGRTSIAPVSTYSIDGGVAQLYTPTLEKDTQYQQLFFQSPNLPDGPHELVIHHNELSEPFYLDYMVVNQDTSTSTDTTSATIPIASPPVPVPVPTSSAPVTTVVTSGTTNPSAASSSSSPAIAPTEASSSTTDSPLATSTPQQNIDPPLSVSSTTVGFSQDPSLAANGLNHANSTASSTPSETAVASSSNASKSSNVGAVVGGVVTAIAALLILTVGVVLWRRRRARRRLRLPPSSLWTRQYASGGTPPPNPFTARAMAHANSPPHPYTAPQPYYDPEGYAPDQDRKNAAGNSSEMLYQDSTAAPHTYALPSQLMSQPNNDYAQRGMGGPTGYAY